MLSMLIVEAEIKWFSRRRDFGFLVSTQDSSQFGDILIRGDVVRKTAGMTIEPGTKVTCSVVSAAGKGFRAIAVQEVVKPVHFSRFLRATVKWYRDDFGFLVASGYPDIFIHASVLKRAGMAPLTPNDQVLVRVARSEHGSCAPLPCARFLPLRHGNSATRPITTMSIVSHRLPPTSAQSIIAQSLAMALVHIRLTEGGAESHPH